MPAFVLVDATARTIKLETFKELRIAQEQLGLVGVDHGSFGRGFGYVVDEFGLFIPAHLQHYFSVGPLLIAGNMVVYAYDSTGDTVDMSEGQLRMIEQAVTFFDGPEEIERAINCGDIFRPQTSVDGKVIWQWPEKDPEARGDVAS